uniref:Uncharacterized protein n=1 Tax=Anguilla anguilla TaxID=7936 RepID=A0A0E9SXR4_ANGAN
MTAVNLRLLYFLNDMF